PFRPDVQTDPQRPNRGMSSIPPWYYGGSAGNHRPGHCRGCFTNRCRHYCDEEHGASALVAGGSLNCDHGRIFGCKNLSFREVFSGLLVDGPQAIILFEAQFTAGIYQLMPKKEAYMERIKTEG